MSKEAHFHLFVYVNRQKYRSWGTLNPRIIYEEPLNLQKVTAWCTVDTGGVIGPYAAGQTIIVNGERYRAMINKCFLLELDKLELKNMWIKQEGAISHNAGSTTEILKNAFQGRQISCFGDGHWPAKSPDLTVPDFFLCFFLNHEFMPNFYRPLKPSNRIYASKARICRQ